MKNFITKILLVIGFVLFNQASVTAQKTLPQPPSTAYNVYSGENKTVTDNVSITLKPGVHIRLGSEFHAYITGVPPQTTPNTPTSLVVTAVSTSQINLTWADNSNNETGFKLEWALNTNGPFTQIVQAENATSYSHTGLSAETTYYYRIQAYNEAGNSGYSSVVSTTTFSAPSGKPRVIVSTDIGGGDFDDHQSLIHFLLYANILDIRGFISSPPFGDEEAFTEVWNAYGLDYDDLNSCIGAGYPTKQHLKDLMIIGYVDESGNQLVRPSSGLPQSPDKQPLHPKARAVNPGADLIVTEAKNASSTSPLYVLAWGGLADVAQALFILNEEGTTVAQNAINNIRLYSIGSWNTENDKVSREYVYNNFSNLWWIESDATFFGMFKIKSLKDSKPSFYGDDANYGKLGFIDNNIRNHGELGKLYGQVSDDPTMNGRLKEGDSPSFLYMISNLVSGNIGNLDDPTADSWGGAYVKPVPAHGSHYWTDNKNPALKEDNFGCCEVTYGAKTVNKYRIQMLDDFAEKMACLPNNGRYGGKPSSQSMKTMVYPNPSSGTISIQSPVFKSEFNLKIVDKLNQNINFKTLGQSGETIKIDIDGEDGEVYFIKVNTTHGMFVKKIFLRK